MEKEFKELFEKAYGEGSYNDDFLITADSAYSLAMAFLKHNQGSKGEEVK